MKTIRNSKAVAILSDMRLKKVAEMIESMLPDDEVFVLVTAEHGVASNLGSDDRVSLLTECLEALDQYVADHADGA